ncbi:hypothetical protein ABT237_35410 [Streptomyces sp. NPDC001581]|uniref:hypothetical protein n=1 Tax=Streptomyces sp. NPDC001581 TaxID=3154386 RepID=UPI0033309D0E
MRAASLGSASWPGITASMGRLDAAGIEVERILADAARAGVAVAGRRRCHRGPPEEMTREQMREPAAHYNGGPYHQGDGAQAYGRLFGSSLDDAGGALR